MHTSHRGFVALITVLILAAVLMVAVVTLAQYGITARYALLALEHKTTSEGRAGACIASARVAVVGDPSWTATNKVVPVGTGTCIIESVNTVSGNRRIKVSGVSGDATTNYVVDIAPSTGALVQLVEVPN